MIKKIVLAASLCCLSGMSFGMQRDWREWELGSCACDGVRDTLYVSYVDMAIVAREYGFDYDPWYLERFNENDLANRLVEIQADDQLRERVIRLARNLARSGIPHREPTSFYYGYDISRVCIHQDRQ